MLLYVLLGPALLTAPVYSQVQSETKHARISVRPRTSSDNIDIIRNISKFYNALLELIKNYEQIYKTKSFGLGDNSNHSKDRNRTKVMKEKEFIGSTSRPHKRRNDSKSPRSGYLRRQKDPDSFRFNKSRAVYSDFNKNKDPDSNSTAEEKEQHREIFMNHLSRKAYGDACTKVAVRKCFKAKQNKIAINYNTSTACKLAVKRACSSSGCKSSFKESFKLHSRTGCLNQFDISSPTTETTTTTTTTEASLKPLRRKGLTVEYIKVPGGGIDFPDVDMPARSSKKMPIVKTYVEAARPQNQSKLRTGAERGLFDLRRKTEQVCDRCSRRKCKKACLFAFEKTCSIFHCPPRRKANLRRHCKRECYHEYKSHSSEETSSGSSTSNSRDSITVSKDFD